MVDYLQENGSISIDEFIESLVTQKILNLNENNVFIQLASAIKRTFCRDDRSSAINIFIRASLADSTYKSKLTTLPFTDVVARRAKESHKPSILSWIKNSKAKKSEDPRRTDISDDSTNDGEHDRKVSVNQCTDLPVHDSSETATEIKEKLSTKEFDTDIHADSQPVTLMSAKEPVDNHEEAINNVMLAMNCDRVPQYLRRSRRIQRTSIEDVDGYNLGTNVIVIHGRANGLMCSYYLASKVYKVDLHTLVRPLDVLESNYLKVQNFKLQHICCKELTTEELDLNVLCDYLTSKNTRICILEGFELLSVEYQMLMNKRFLSVRDKLFILTCKNLNLLDARIRSCSYHYRVTSLDLDKCTTHIHNLCSSKNRYRCGLSRLNVMEIINRTGSDVFRLYNAMISAQKNYNNPLAKVKGNGAQKLLRNLANLILQSKVDQNTLLNIRKINFDLLSIYGTHAVEQLLLDFYFKLFDITDTLDHVKDRIHHIIANAFVKSPLLLQEEDACEYQDAALQSMEMLVLDLIKLVDSTRLV